MKAESIVFGQREVIEELTCPSICYPNPRKIADTSQSAIVGFQAQSKKTTCKGKLSLCEVSTPMLKSSKTSVLESTLSGKDCSPYWNEACRELLLHLWLPTETVLQDLGQGLSSSFSTGMVGKSWVSTRFHFLQKRNLQETCLPFCTSSPVVFMDSENTKLKSRKTRVYPTMTQRWILRRWMGASRYVYNQTIAYLKQPGTIANWMEIKKWLLPSLPDWAKEIPYQIKAIAVKDACNAVKRCKMVFKQTHQFHEAKFRSRRSPSQSIFIPKSAVNIDHGTYYTILGNLKSYEPYPQPQGDCRLTLESGRWFVCVPIAADTRTENQGRVVAIDPGVRTFTTFYSPESCGKLGTGDFSRIQRLCHHLDDLISRMSKAAHKQRYKMKQAASECAGRFAT